MAKAHLKIRSGLLVKGVTAYPSDPEEGDLVYRSDLFKYSIYRNGNWADLLDDRLVQVMSSTNSSLTGSNADLASTPTPFVRLTNASLVSVESIVAGGDGQTVTLTNATGNPILILDETGGTPANRIKTGQSKPITLGTDGSITLIYDATTARWRVVAGPGASSGNGTGDDLDSLLYRASFTESFPEPGTVSTSSVDVTAVHTNATFNAAKAMWAINYDASKTIAAGTTTTNIVINTAPGFTVVAGDIVLFGSAANKITAVISQTNFTTEAFASAPTLAGQVTISQAVHTKDIYNFTVDGVALSAGFSGATFSEITVTYKDNGSSGSNTWTPNTTPFVAWTGSNDNTNWTSLQARATNETDTQNSSFLPSAGTGLYLRFFADKTSGSGVVNLIYYKAFMQKNVTSASTFNAIWSAYATTNSSTTPINCTVSVAGGKSTLTFTGGNQYPVGVLTGQTKGSLEVILNGQVLPRFVASSVPTTDGYYTEVSPTIIQLDRDYSSVQLEVQVIYSISSVDSSSTNTTQITNTQTFLATPPVCRNVGAGSGTINLNYVFYTATCNATTGATYTNNGITYTVLNTVSGATQLVANGNNIPALAGTLTKASGTGDATISFFAYKAPLWLRVRMSGPGGGGAGGGIATPGNGGNGSAATTFGTSFLSCGPGLGGAWQGSSGGNGGGFSVTGTTGFYVCAQMAGGQGQSTAGEAGGLNIQSVGPMGGSNAFGSPGGSNDPASGYGGGGGGGIASSSAGTPCYTGASGGAGAYLEVMIYSLALSYAYVVGTGGSGGSNTTAGGPGGNGGNGVIILEEHYVGG